MTEPTRRGRPTKPTESSEASLIRALRFSLAMTQQEFSDRLGVSVTTIARYEGGRRPETNVLSRMVNLAHCNGFTSLAEEFAAELLKDIATSIAGYRLAIEWRDAITWPWKDESIDKAFEGGSDATRV